MTIRREFCLLLIALAGCAEPYAVTDIGDNAYYRQPQSYAAGDGLLSRQSTQFLAQHSLLGSYQNSTREAIEALLAQFRLQPSRTSAFTLAELCYMEGSRHTTASDESSRFFLTASILAYAVLFDKELPGACNSLDRRYGMACEIYNRALSRIIAGRPLTEKNWNDDTTLASLIGPVRFSKQTWKLPWPQNQFQRFDYAYRFNASEIDFPSRQEGLGVPLVAFRTRDAAEPHSDVDAFIPNIPSYAIAATLCLRFQLETVAAAVRNTGGEISADVSVLDPLAEGSIQIDGHSIPLEADFMMPLALTIQNAPQVSGFKGFMDTTAWENRRGLYMVHPFQKGKIPVVLVNGLMGKPQTWVPLYNALTSNEVLRSRYQFWYFMYPTGNPVLYSAAILREDLLKARRVFDPEGTDPAFNQMVIVGHSMGGLVTRMQVTNSADEIWKAVVNRPFDSFTVPEPIKNLTRSVFFFDSLPFVKRVIFMATPHRGSALADKWFAEIFSADVKLPDQVRIAEEQFIMKDGNPSISNRDHLPTAVDGLSAENPVLLACERLHIAPGVKYHSIIANKKAAGQIGGTDSIVPYASAHLDGASSEVIIHSGHSCTRNPDAIYEVERILLTHLAEIDAAITPAATKVSPRPSTSASAR